MFKFLLPFALVALAAATPFRDCGSTATDIALRVPNCNTLPCVVIRGTNVTIEIDFTASAASDSIDTDVSGTFLGITAPWPGTFPPGCSMLVGGDCPLAAGESAFYQAFLAIQSDWPAVTATATWKIVNDAGASIVCLQVPLNLV